METVAALRLLAVVVLPMRLFEMFMTPDVARMPVSEAELLVTVAFTVMEPMVLLAMATVLPSEPMPKVVPPFVVTESEPLPVSLPMVLPAAVHVCHA